jgi:hypothetical protein
VESLRRQETSQGFKDGASMDKQGGQISRLALSWGALNQIAPQIANHKATHRGSLGQDAFKESIKGARGESFHPTFDQQDAATIRPDPLRFFEDIHSVTVLVQQTGQQQTRAASSDNGNAEWRTNHR